MITTFAGSGDPGHAGDGGPDRAAAVGGPVAVTVGSDGTTHVLDGQRVRAIGSHGTIRTVVGTGTAGFTGDGGPATAATISVEDARQPS